MKTASINETLQTATTISKTTQTLIGKEIATGHYDFITLFFVYTRGDETGLTIIPSFMHSSEGTAYPFAEWSSASGAKTLTASTFTMTATTSGYIRLDVRGISYVKFTQGGSANDGTPTGTLAATYSLQ